MRICGIYSFAGICNSQSLTEVFIREGLVKTVPWQEMDCQVIGQADNSVDALEIIEKMKPDIHFWKYWSNIEYKMQKDCYERQIIEYMK